MAKHSNSRAIPNRCPAGRTTHAWLGTAFLCSALATGTLVAATHYVTPLGSAAPERDDPSRPWQLVEAAVRALPNEGGAVSLGSGTYRETFTIDRPATLTAPTGGAVIGDLTHGVAATTTFSVLTWNTHLAGDELFLPSWLDYERAAEMGGNFAARRHEIDLVSLCEVWDEELFVGEIGFAGIRLLSGYQNWIHGTRVDQQAEWCFGVYFPTVLNSGLAMMSDHAMHDPAQISFSDCEGSCPSDKSPDCLASKGFIVTTVIKDGFHLRIYNTHAQAGNGGDAYEARRHQIEQMAAHISAYRNENPSHLVMLMGDINIIGETEDQYGFLRESFGAIGGRDAARNAADEMMYGDPSIAHTITFFNELAVHFDSAPYDQRLDYVWYFPSLDGKVQMLPTRVTRDLTVARGTIKAGFGGIKVLVSDELSDHYPIRAVFQLYRDL